MLSPTKLDNFLITKIKLEFGSITIGFFSIYLIKSNSFLFIKLRRLTLPMYLLSLETI